MDVHPKICGTLVASGAGMNRPGRMASETDLCIVVPDEAVIPINDKAARCNGDGDTAVMMVRAMVLASEKMAILRRQSHRVTVMPLQRTACKAT